MFPQVEVGVVVVGVAMVMVVVGVVVKRPKVFRSEKTCLA